MCCGSQPCSQKTPSDGPAGRSVHTSELGLAGFDEGRVKPREPHQEQRTEIKMYDIDILIPLGFAAPCIGFFDGPGRLCCGSEPCSDTPSDELTGPSVHPSEQGLISGGQSHANLRQQQQQRKYKLPQHPTSRSR